MTIMFISKNQFVGVTHIRSKKMQKEFVLKAKNTIKRIAAISTGALMLGATALGAVAAADLGDYPAPFIADGQWNTLLVVGTGGTDPAGLAADLAGTVDIAARLAQTSTTAVSTTTTVVGGATEDEVALNGTIGVNKFANALTDTDIASLIDSTISYDDGTGSKDYDVHEFINMSSDFRVVTSLQDNDYSGDDYPDLVAMSLEDDSLEYCYKFDENIDTVTPNENRTISITFLGQGLEIENFASDSMTAKTSNEINMQAGDTFAADTGDTVLVDYIYSTSVSVTIGDRTKIISSGNQYDFGDTTVKISDIGYDANNPENSRAILRVGEDVTKQYADGEPYIGEDDDDPDWIFKYQSLTAAANETPEICVINDNSWNSPDEDLPVIGEYYEFPEGFMKVNFDLITAVNYATITLDFDNSEDLYNITGGATGVGYVQNEKVLIIEAPGDEDLVINGTVKTDKIYLSALESGNATYIHYYDDDTNKPQYYNWTWWDAKTGATNNHFIANITLGDTEIPIYWFSRVNNTSQGNLTIATSDEHGANITFRLNNKSSAVDFTQFGTTAEDDDTDLYIGALLKASADNDILQQYGVIIKTPENNLEVDKAILMVPDDRVYAQISLIPTDATVTTLGSSTVTVNSIAGVPLIKLDTEVTDKTSKPMILIGGPAVNKLTAEALGVTYPSYGADSTIPENKGLIKLVENAFGGTNVALVVAGWGASDTRNAANILKSYDTYSLSGLAVQVSGTTVTAVASGTTVQ